MALSPQERATTANQMMQILNNSGGGESQGLKVLDLTTTQSENDFFNASFTNINDTNFPGITAHFNDFAQGKYDKLLITIGTATKYSFYLMKQEDDKYSDSFRFTGIGLNGQTLVFMDIYGVSLFSTWTCSYFRRIL